MVDKLLKKTLLLFFSSFCVFFLSGGTNPVDSIKELLHKYPSNPKYLNDLAEFLLDESSYQAVDSLASLALSHATDQRNATQHARAQFLIGEVAWYENDMERAIVYYRHSAENYEDAGELMYAAQSLNNLAHTLLSVNRTDEALSVFNKSMAFLLKLDDFENLPFVLVNIGLVYRDKAMYDSALFFNRQAISLGQTPGSEELLNAAYANQGYIYKSIGDFQQAIEYYQMALNISKEYLGDHAQAVNLNNIAAVFLEWGNYEMAEVYFNRVLGKMQLVNNSIGIEICLNNLAMVKQKQGMPDSALVLLQQSLAMANDLGRESSAAVKLNNIASIYYDFADYETAIRYVNKAVEIQQRLGRRMEEANALKNKGSILLAMNAYEDAVIALNKALLIANEVESNLLRINILEAQSRLYERMGLYHKALAVYKEYVAIKDSVFAETTQRTLAEMETRYRTEEKRKQLTLLTLENDLNRAEIRKKRNNEITLFVGVVILLIASALIWYSYLQKNKAYRLLVKKNLELLQKNKKDSTMPPAPKASPTLIKDDDIARIIEGVEELLIKDRIYLDQQLSLAAMSEKLNTNTAYLSHIINTYFETNFKGLINKYRIEEAQKLIADLEHEKTTIEGIADMVGFASRSAFNDVFKKQTGVPPGVFIKNVKKLKK